MITMILVFCLIVVLIGFAIGALVLGICSIGTLLALGFELALYLMPVIIIYMIARVIWKMTTTKKTIDKVKEKE